MWISTADAAVLLRVVSNHVSYLTRNGHLKSVRQVGRQRWLRRSEVEALVKERAHWVSYVDAAAMIGCSTATVSALVRAGHLLQRRAGTNAVASLGRESVERAARERATAAAERAAAAPSRPIEAPPDDDHDWIGPRAAAEVLGVSSSAARWMAREELVPALKRGRRWWFRRDQVLLVANARAARGLHA